MICTEHRKQCKITKDDPSIKHIEDSNPCDTYDLTVYCQKRVNTYTATLIVATVKDTDWEPDTE